MAAEKNFVNEDSTNARQFNKHLGPSIPPPGRLAVATVTPAELARLNRGLEDPAVRDVRDLAYWHHLCEKYGQHPLKMSVDDDTCKFYVREEPSKFESFVRDDSEQGKIVRKVLVVEHYGGGLRFITLLVDGRQRHAWIKTAEELAVVVDNGRWERVDPLNFRRVQEVQ